MKQQAFYIPINHKNIETNEKQKNQISEKEVLNLIKIICSDNSILKIGQNIKYDISNFKKI